MAVGISKYSLIKGRPEVKGEAVALPIVAKKARRMVGLLVLVIGVLLVWIAKNARA